MLAGLSCTDLMCWYPAVLEVLEADAVVKCLLATLLDVSLVAIVVVTGQQEDCRLERLPGLYYRGSDLPPQVSGLAVMMMADVAAVL